MNNPYRVTTPDGRVALIVSNPAEGVPLHVAIRCSGARGILRFAGTSSENTPKHEQTKLYTFMETTFKDSDLQNVVLMSGGTRSLDTNGQTVVTVLEIPSMVRQWCPTCRTLGSTPQTTPTMSLVEDSRFVPSDQLDSRVLINPSMDVVWIVQLSASQTLPDFGLDVPVYFDHLDAMREEGLATGLIVWGGGGVTAREVHMAVARQHPVAVIANSGRVATALTLWQQGRLHKMSDPALGDWNVTALHPTSYVVVHNPEEARNWLALTGFMDNL